MGVNNYDTTRTPLGEPPTVPVIEGLKPLGAARVEIRVHDEKTPGRRAIPKSYNGCVLKYAWGPAPITDLNALTHSKLATHFPYTLDLPPEAAGSVLTVAAYWQIRDLLGKSGNIESVVIA
jgi:hypothetical protein